LLRKGNLNLPVHHKKEKQCLPTKLNITLTKQAFGLNVATYSLEKLFLCHSCRLPEEPPVYKKSGNVSRGSIGASFMEFIDRKEMRGSGSPGESLDE